VVLAVIQARPVVRLDDSLEVTRPVVRPANNMAAMLPALPAQYCGVTNGLGAIGPPMVVTAQ
jgi:hypothetical protein